MFATNMLNFFSLIFFAFHIYQFIMHSYYMRREKKTRKITGIGESEVRVSSGHSNSNIPPIPPQKRQLVLFPPLRMAWPPFQFNFAAFLISVDSVFSFPPPRGNFFFVFNSKLAFSNSPSTSVSVHFHCALTNTYVILVYK